MFVQMVERDFIQLKNACNFLQNKLAEQEQKMAQLMAVNQQLAEQVKKMGGQAAAATNPDDQVVGAHPETGQPVTVGDLKKNPKLKLKMMFSDPGAA